MDLKSEMTKKKMYHSLVITPSGTFFSDPFRFLATRRPCIPALLSAISPIYSRLICDTLNKVTVVTLYVS
jgi:hypothetical protein